MKLDEAHIIAPDHSHLFAAMGSALNCKPEISMELKTILQKLSSEIKM